MSIKGVGLSWRPEFSPFAPKLAAQLDFFEILPEIYLRKELFTGAHPLAQLNLPLCAHASTLSLGHQGPRKTSKARALKKLLDQWNIEVISDHLSFNQGAGWDTQNFIPAMYDDCGLELFSRNLKSTQKELKRQVLLENITRFYFWEKSAYQECQFFKKIVYETDAGILLDLNNLYVNAQNLGHDPYQYIRSLPAEAVVGLHLAGFEKQKGIYFDSHMSNMSPQVLKLAAYALKKTAAQFIVLERDNGSADLATLSAEIKIMSSLWKKHR